MVQCPLCGDDIADQKAALAHFDDECWAVPRLRPQSIPTRAARLADRVVGFIANILPTKPQ